MRWLFIPVFILLIISSEAQQKQLSLEDAVWGRYTYLNPKSQSFSWKNDNTFSFV